ncbi:hypothetical protein ACFL5H_00355 [Candidatus Latescibacterota bacterium]
MMEDIVIRILMNGGPSAVVVAIGFVIVRMQIKELKADIGELKEGKRWTETCESTHKEVDRRLNRLETVINGIGKR